MTFVNYGLIAATLAYTVNGGLIQGTDYRDSSFSAFADPNGDTITFSQTGDWAFLNGGSDVLISGSNALDVISGGDGDELFVNGNEGNDIVVGGPGNDKFLRGNGGSDIVDGSDGNDEFLQGGDGADTIRGGNGDDTNLVGDKGNDFMDGGPGDDELGGGSADPTDVNYLKGGPGNDILLGTSAKDIFILELSGGTDSNPQGGTGAFDASLDVIQKPTGTTSNVAHVSGSTIVTVGSGSTGTSLIIEGQIINPTITTPN